MMRPAKLVQRFVLPSFVVSLIYAFRFRALVSPRAAVELSPRLELVGKGTQISSFTKIKASDGPLTIGARVSIGSGCFIHAGSAGVSIGDDCLISPNVSIVGSNYRYDRLDIPVRQQGESAKGVTIGNDVWIGVGCAILDGARIGDHVIVAPNAVVSGPVAANVIVAGNPAKAIFTRR
jgi:acetyltransferase-like isoleucine patch superfamily enzyme